MGRKLKQTASVRCIDLQGREILAIAELSYCKDANDIVQVICRFESKFLELSIPRRHFIDALTRPVRTRIFQFSEVEVDGARTIVVGFNEGPIGEVLFEKSTVALFLSKTRVVAPDAESVDLMRYATESVD